MRDSTTPVASIQPGTTDRIAAYWNGLFAANFDELQRVFSGVRLYGIDVLGTDPHKASVADVEKFDMTPDSLAEWIPARLDAGPQDGHGEPTWLARPYCNLSTWPSVRAVVARLDAKYRRQVRYWIANPTGIRHLVPGSAATQFWWGSSSDNFDISDVDPSWDQ
jgi:hypothetical protein